MRARNLLLVIALCACDRPAPQPGGATPLLDAESPADLTALVRDLMPRLERISGLDRTATVKLRRQDRNAARAYVKRRLDEEMPPAEREGLRRVYVAFGVMPDTLDLDALLLDLYTEQVLGYYDPGTKTMYVVEGADAESLRPVLAHELVHALQDQYANLDSLISKERGNDRKSAAHAALEGHAMVVMFTVLAELASKRNVDPASLPSPADELRPALEQQNSEFPVFQRAPAIVRETLLFPYLAGSGFVHALWSAIAPQERYPAPLDSLLPQSTEQVLHARERFIAMRDTAVELRFDSIPVGWQVVHEDNLGELEMSAVLEQRGGRASRVAAQGWDGDRYVLLRDEKGREALHWVSIWDDAASADRFAAAIRRWPPDPSRGAPSVDRTTLNGREAVSFVLPPEQTAAAALPRPVPRL